MAVRTQRAKHTEQFQESVGVICVGSLVAFECKNQEAHAAGRRIRAAKHNSVKIDPQQLWDTCWKCHKPMGCPGCVANPICVSCLVITDHEFFIENGPLSNDLTSIARRDGRRGPPISLYPSGWQMEYLLAHPDTATTEDQVLFERFKRDMQKLTKRMKGMYPAPKREEELVKA